MESVADFNRGKKNLNSQIPGYTHVGRQIEDLE